MIAMKVVFVPVHANSGLEGVSTYRMVSVNVPVLFTTSEIGFGPEPEAVNPFEVPKADVAVQVKVAPVTLN